MTPQARAEGALAPTVAARVIAWHARDGRHDLPWQGTRDPYAIWVSEIMLQQTQVSTVIPYYRRFMARFPDVRTLAAAPEDDVLQLWSGLGYYARARNLQRAAQVICEQHGERFPTDFEAVAALPGIGRSTAGAVLAFSSGARLPILDGNVKRVLARFFGVPGYPGETRVAAALWQHAERALPDKGIEAYTQGMMDLGARVCLRRRPLCPVCPLVDGCVAYAGNLQGELPGSKPRKALPSRDTVMLVLQRDGEVLLEKRPAPGIWGGLWSFPEVAGDGDLAQTCRQRFGADVEQLAPLPDVAHTFTHFRLNITPQLLRVTSLQPRAGQAAGMWLALPDALGAAVPTPVRRILEDLSKLQLPARCLELASKEKKS